MDQRNDPLRLAAALGVRSLSWTAQTWGGGGNNMAAAVQLADAAISAGYARHVVAFRALAQGQFGRYGQSRTAGRIGGDFAYEHLYGMLSPAQECALQTKRFMHDHGDLAGGALPRSRSPRTPTRSATRARSATASRSRAPSTTPRAGSWSRSISTTAARRTTAPRRSW